MDTAIAVANMGVYHHIFGISPMVDATEGEEKMSDKIQVSPAHEQVARRAYEIYLEGGGIGGNDLVNWFLAEQELKVGLHRPSAEPGRAKADGQTGRATRS